MYLLDKHKSVNAPWFHINVITVSEAVLHQIKQISTNLWAMLWYKFKYAELLERRTKSITLQDVHIAHM